MVAFGDCPKGFSLFSTESVPFPSTSGPFFGSFGTLTSVGVVGGVGLRNTATGVSGGFWVLMGSPGGRIGEGGQGL